MLLTESASPTTFKPEKVEKVAPSTTIYESHGEKVPGLMKVTGVFQRYDTVNSNGRLYPKELFERVLGEEGDFCGRMKGKQVLSLLEHPEDGLTRLDRPICAIVTNAWDKGDGFIMGEAVVLNTEAGKNLAAIFEAGGSVGISSRGDGDLELSEGVNRVVPESYSLVTWDFVFDNSVPGAKMKPVKESVEESSTPTDSPKDSAPQESVVKFFFRDLVESGKTFAEIQGAMNSKFGNFDWSQCINAEILQESKNQKPNLQNTMSNKLGEMRKLDLEVTRLPQIAEARKYKTGAKSALMDNVIELRSRVDTLMAEDVSVKSYGDKVVKRLNEYEEQMDDDFEMEPPAEPDVDVDVNIDKKGEEASLSCEDFCLVMNPVLTELCSDADPESIDASSKNLYERWSEGAPLELNAEIESLCSEESEEDVEPVSDDEMLESAMRVISKLSEGKDDSTKTRELKSLLRRARNELVESKDLNKKFRKNVSLLREARNHIEDIEDQLTEQTEMTQACISLLKEHGIKDASALMKDKLEENSDSKNQKPKNKKVNESKKDKPEELPTWRDQKIEESKRLEEENKDKLDESEVPDLVRVMNRSRQGFSDRY